MLKNKLGDSSVKLSQSEAKLAGVIWANEPLSSYRIATIAERDFEWNKSTTYANLKKICEKGLFKNEKCIVTALISNNEFYMEKSRFYIRDLFDGSLVKFLSAYLSGERISKEKAEEAKNLIDRYTL